MGYTKQLDIKYDIKISNHGGTKVQMKGLLNAFEIKRSAT